MQKLAPKEIKQLQYEIDELGTLDAELALLKPKIDRAKYLKEKLLSRYTDEAPEAAMIAHGQKYSAVISACGNKRSIISITDVRKRLGDREFWAHCSIGLGVLEELLEVQELPEFIKTERIGPRQVKTIPRAA